jgi:hypothetical protein
MFFADKPVHDSLRQFDLNNQTRDQETAHEEKYQLNFVHNINRIERLRLNSVFIVISYSLIDFMIAARGG